MDGWRDECLNVNWFTSLADARAKLLLWREAHPAGHRGVGTIIVRPHDASGQSGIKPGEYVEFEQVRDDDTTSRGRG